MEDSYKNREIDEKFHDMHDKLDMILAQTTKTNGRVSSIENWRWMITGGFGMVSFVVIPMVIYVFNSKVVEVARAADDIKTMCQYR